MFLGRAAVTQNLICQEAGYVQIAIWPKGDPIGNVQIRDPVSIGIGPQDMDEVALEQASIRNCREAYLLVDHSKFQRSDFWVIGQLTQLKAVITDAGISPERVKEMESAGIPCIVA